MVFKSTSRFVRRLRFGALLSAAVVAAVVLQAGGAASSPSPYAGRIGVNTHLVWVSQAESQPVFDQIRRGGVEWVREEFPWSAVEPQRGVFSWSSTDAMMTAAAHTGVNVLGLLVYSAPWASSDPTGNGDNKYPPRSNGDYARYAAAVVSRYGPGGSFWVSRPDLNPRPLTAVEIWNEPWGHWFWKPNPSPSAYAALARAAAIAIRAANPKVKILIAGDLLQVRTDGRIVDWLKSQRAADPGLAGLADAYSVHPYPHPRTLGPWDDRADPRWDFQRVKLTHELDPSLPIWITEVGWSTASTDDSVNEATQAAYTRGVLERSLKNWGSYIERVFLYSFDRDGGRRSDREQYYGMRREDGTFKSSWSAVVKLASGSRSATARRPTATKAKAKAKPTATPKVRSQRRTKS